MARKVYEIKECSYDCPLHSQCAYDDTPCTFYGEDPEMAMGKSDKKPKFCKVKRVIVEEET